MDLILTHDNADFDAVASQLAAHKIYPDARPLLSNRLNRNVRHFLAIYWDELPFMRTRDLVKEPVERVVVVDTQTVQTVRGMSPETAVRIVDHHTLRESLNPAWQVTLDETGACSTILCEWLRAERVSLTPVEATLLLLGIYEDTGALTYGSTTARDGYAASWLLEQGAVLDVVRDFLHYPLGEDQISLFEQLEETVHTYDIAGHPVAIAYGSAPDLVEEIATLAHKLRDLLDPAAVFLLVNLGHHIQLVARSSVDALNVGEIAEEFGGGGHGRAAAAILRNITLEEAVQALLTVLRREVRPALTVEDMMSYGVQTLSPYMRVRDAVVKMQRYGHEGFPVVEGGKVIGLLTRRAVDRAVGHGLMGVRIDQLMEAGEVVLDAGDSLATVQQTMMETGWGQIPVTGDEGNIIGVVTRTDLIKAMGHTAPVLTLQSEVAEMLDRTLPPVLVALIRATGSLAAEMGASLFMVGGGVRDLLLGKPTIDIDFVVEGNAIALAHAMSERFGGGVRTHRRFRTGKWLLDAPTWVQIAEALEMPGAASNGERLPQHIDFATARTEFYDAPTVLPEVERSSIKADLHRRDFTINTLAIRLDPQNFGQLLDFYGGEKDLQQGRIRVLHSLSFVDDPTRIMRAVRFEQRLDFKIEPRTLELLENAIPLIDRVTGERIKHELELIFDEPLPERALSRLNSLGVLETLHSDLVCGDWTVAAFRALRSAVSPPLWPELGAEDFDLELPYFALLLYHFSLEDMRALSKRLHVRRTTVTALEAVLKLRDFMAASHAEMKPSVIDRTLRLAGDPALVTLWAAAPTAGARAVIIDYARRLRYIKPLITGRELVARGLKPGPRVGRLLRALREAWLDGEITSPEEEASLVEVLLHSPAIVEDES